jgi:hypothetical protein
MARRRTSAVGPAGDSKNIKIPAGAVRADIQRQRRNDWENVRYYYTARPFSCKRCGKEEIWTVEQQKHWYEDCHGDPDSVAVHCHDCRKGSEGTDGGA